MSRFIFWGILAFVGWHLLNRWLSQRDRDDESGSSSSTRPRHEPPAPQDMVRCEHCGLHLPRSDAVTNGDHAFYCSAEHARSSSPHR